MAKIAVHYGTTFAVGAIATWIFQWTAVEWLVYFVFCDLWYILRETRDSGVFGAIFKRR